MATATKKTAAPFVPEDHALPILREAIQKCRGCDLYRHATQAVFGELEMGTRARKPKVTIMMVGEQPGDQEDTDGRPFVGPAGKLLNNCLEAAGIDRREVYITNTVKHFKWEPRGKLRIHKKRDIAEIHACRPWLDAELETVRPRLVVCLGSVAAQSLLGTKFKVTQSHGEVHEIAGLPPIIATLHPSAVLRARTAEDREHDRKTLLEDLRRVASFLRNDLRFKAHDRRPIEENVPPSRVMSC
jgi:uracil-DNA glycosylase family protein